MSRPVKLRKVCDLPESNEFGPLDSALGHRDFVNMEIDEYETIRLIDLEGFSQEEIYTFCGKDDAVVTMTLRPDTNSSAQYGTWLERILTIERVRNGIM